MVQDLADGLTGLLPDELGAREAARFLASAGTSMSPLAALAALLPASLYGEGLVRAFDRFSDRPSRRRSARGRLGSLVVVALSPVLLLGGLSAAQALTTVLGDSTLDRLLGVYFAFLVGWLTISPGARLRLPRADDRAPGPPGAAVGRGRAPARSCRAPAWASCCSCRSASTSAGRTAAPRHLATAAACVGWLFVLHVIVLVGYVTTLVLEAREGHPLARRRSSG